MDTFNRQTIGKQAEEDACQFLCGQGLRLLTRNYYCYLGEIDLIMQDENAIVFVEVRSRNRTDYGNAFESINRNKRKKLHKTALHFLQKKALLYKVSSRFDIIAIHPIDGVRQLEWIKNAFSIDTY